METARYVSYLEFEKQKKLNQEKTEQALKEYYANTSNVTVIDANYRKIERQKQAEAYEKFMVEYKAFYSTTEWKKLRNQVIQEHKANNQLFCIACGTTEKLVVDHINPVKIYWEERLERKNLHILCNDCNLGKGSQTINDTNKPIQEKIIDLRKDKEKRDEGRLKYIVRNKLEKTLKKPDMVNNTYNAYFAYRFKAKQNGNIPMDIDMFIKVVRDNTAYYFDEYPSNKVKKFLKELPARRNLNINHS